MGRVGMKPVLSDTTLARTDLTFDPTLACWVTYGKAYVTSPFRRPA